MFEKVRQYIIDNCMIEKNDVVILGLSGGPDSVCLLSLLCDLKEEMKFELHAVHVNHLLRGEDADGDEAYVRSLCEQYGVKLTVIREDVNRYAREMKLSTEEAGRMIRRKAFEKMGAHCKIALAHHMDDNVETVIHNMSRGTGIRGICGIKPVAGNYIRPLLCVRRDEIESYLKEMGLDARIDQTNLTDGYTRNRIRNHVIPYLETEVNEQTVKHIHSLATQMSELRDFVERQVDSCWDKVVTVQSEDEKPGNVLVDIPELEKLDKVLVPYLLRRVLALASGSEKDIEEVHLLALSELTKKQTGRQIHLPYDMVAVRSYDKIVIERSKSISIGGENGLNPGKTIVGEGEEIELLPSERVENGWKREVTLPDGRKITLKVFDVAKLSMPIEERTYTKWFDYAIITGGVDVRTRKAGDQIVVDQDGHAQKLKKYFINAKIPSKLREETLLIAEGHEILWVIGHRQSKKYQIKSNTQQVLEIKVM